MRGGDYDFQWRAAETRGDDEEDEKAVGSLAGTGLFPFEKSRALLAAEDRQDQSIRRLRVNQSESFHRSTSVQPVGLGKGNSPFRGSAVS